MHSEIRSAEPRVVQSKPEQFAQLGWGYMKLGHKEAKVELLTLEPLPPCGDSGGAGGAEAGAVHRLA